MDLDVAAADRGDGLAEIDLHDAGVPVEFEVPVVVRTMLLAPLLHVALHGRRALSPPLLHEPVVHASGGRDAACAP